MANTTFNGPVRSENGFQAVSKNSTTGAVTVTATLTGSTAGFFGAAPVAQPTTAVTAAAFSAGTSGIVDDTATFGGYTVGQVVAALKNLGLLA